VFFRGNHTYEVDEFYGANEGLTVAEIELESKGNFHETKLAWNRGY
jgi:adenylate cyclase